MRKLTIGSHLLFGASSLFVLPFLAISFYYIFFYHVSPLSRDQWHMYAPYFEQGLWKTMLSPMSTHRHIFPYLLFHADMEWFGGNNHFLIACGTFFNLLLTILLARYIYAESNIPIPSRAAMIIFVFCQMLWLVNYAQLGWGFMSAQYYLAILTLFAAVISAQHYYQKDHRLRWMVLCLLCGWISTFSFGMGILVWPILFYFLWGWRIRDRRLLYVLAGLICSLILFLTLPGSDSIRESIIWSPFDSLKFIFQLNAGPIFHLLKSWRLVDQDSLKSIAIIIGGTATAAGVLLLIHSMAVRRSLDGIGMLSHALLLTGLGTSALITFTRSTPFLDPWVDRYQIWSVLFWAGLLLQIAVYSHTWSKPLHTLLISGFLVFPVLAIPSQLDFGSRLYEYKTRVQESLVYYQLGIAHQTAAQEALHWNWEHKLPFFFSTLEKIRAHQKNIFNGSPVYFVGKPVDDLIGNRESVQLDCTLVQNNPISNNQLLDLEYYEGLEQFSGEWKGKNPALNSESIIGWQMAVATPDNFSWNYAVSTDPEGIINGIGIHIQPSILPRPTRTFMKKRYDLYGVAHGDSATPYQWHLLGEDSDENRVGACRQPAVAQASSR